MIDWDESIWSDSAVPWKEGTYGQLVSSFAEVNVSRWLSRFWIEQYEELRCFLAQNPELPSWFLHREFSGGIISNSTSLMLEEMLELGPIPREIFEGQTVFAPSVQTMIHHYYQFMQWKARVEEEPRVVVEWGGGYGNFAFLFKKFYPDATYIIVDLPSMSIVQGSYLSCTELGPEVFVTKRHLVREAVNLLPLHLLGDLDEAVEADLFVSMYGLSESSHQSLRFVLDQEWFGAKHFLLSFEPEKTEMFPVTQTFIENLPSGHRLSGKPSGTDYLVV